MELSDDEAEESKSVSGGSTSAARSGIGSGRSTSVARIAHGPLPETETQSQELFFDDEFGVVEEVVEAKWKYRPDRDYNPRQPSITGSGSAKRSSEDSLDTLFLPETTAGTQVPRLDPDKTPDDAVHTNPPLPDGVGTQTKRVTVLYKKEHAKYIPAEIPEHMKRTGKSVKRDGQKGFSAPTKEVILNVYEWHVLRGFAKPIAETANACGVHESTVRDISRLSNHVPHCDQHDKPSTAKYDVCDCTLHNNTPRFSPWRRKKQGPNKQSWQSKLDAMHFDIIRQCVHKFFKAKESPTLDVILQEVKERLGDEFPFGKDVLRQIMHKKLGMVYITRNNRRCLFERTDLISWRIKFIKQLRKLREDGWTIVYLDETWLNANMYQPKGWVDKQVMKNRDLFKKTKGPNPELSLNLSTPPGRGKRAIVIHAITENGFVDNCLLTFKSEGGKKQLEDYHGDLNAEKFERWFKEQLLVNLPEKCVIVMDNAPYHGRKENRAPTKNDNLAEMRRWLTKNNITHDPKCTTKAPYLSLIQEHKPANDRAVVDLLAEAKGHILLRLPPYHCCLNPIEMAWAEFKRTIKNRIKEWNKLDLVLEFSREEMENINMNKQYFQRLFQVNGLVV